MSAEVDALLKRLDYVKMELGVADSDGDKKRAKPSDAFQALKGELAEQLHIVRKAAKEAATLKESGMDPTATIKKEHEVRSGLKEAKAKWGEMNSYYKTHVAKAGKRKAKYSKEDLIEMKEIVDDYARSLEDLTSSIRAGYTGTAPVVSKRERDDLMSISEDGKVSHGGRSAKPRKHAEATEEQKMRMEQVKKRDAEFDEVLDKIEDSVLELGELAEAIGTEAEKQNMMLENVKKDVDKAQVKLNRLNKRMKETLEKVGRSGDKFCMDVICIIIILGCLSFIYNNLKSQGVLSSSG
eukprot:PLAT9805.1.p1 GENE.PLAT9805.1~~PLAT9805.1.p1  ORF type:complete len:296 (+),score=152.88 PLAT9805.1:80-967(+)